MYICVKFRFPSIFLIFDLVEFSIIKITKSHNSQTIAFFLCTVFIMTFDETGDLVTPVLGTFQKTLTS